MAKKSARFDFNSYAEILEAAQNKNYVVFSCQEFFNSISNLPEKYIKLFGYEFGFYYMKMKNKYGSLFGDKGTLWANMGFSKSLFDDRARISFNIGNLFDSGGFQMQMTKPLYPGEDGVFSNGYVSASEFSDVNYSRNGRTYSLTLKVNFGKMQQDRQKFRDRDHGDGDGMDMGY